METGQQAAQPQYLLQMLCMQFSVRNTKANQVHTLKTSLDSRKKQKQKKNQPFNSFLQAKTAIGKALGWRCRWAAHPEEKAEQRHASLFHLYPLTHWFQVSFCHSHFLRINPPREVKKGRSTKAQKDANAHQHGILQVFGFLFGPSLLKSFLPQAFI